jgi:HAD superfamily hydrolase (TIGR01509 family)
MHAASSFPLGPVNALIFDMDGTIIDTRPFHMASWRQLVKDHGLSEREYRIAEAAFGKTNWAIFDEWFEGRADRPSYQALADEKENDFRRIIAGHARPRPGFMELLALARRRGVKIALATSGPRQNAWFLLDQIGVRGAFDAVVWGSNIGLGKPHPAPFLKAAARMGVPPGHCVVFEDSPHGLWAGRRAGMQLVAIAERPEDLAWNAKWTPRVWRDFRPAVELLKLNSK